MDIADQIIVVNIKDNKKVLTEGHYIGRYNKFYNLLASNLANPFKLEDEGDRLNVIYNYREWLWHKIKKRDKFVCKELQFLADKVKKGEVIKLVCWCSPFFCHGHIIKNCLIWMITNNIQFSEK